MAGVPSIGKGGARRISPKRADGGVDETRRARVLDECAERSACASLYQLLESVTGPRSHPSGFPGVRARVCNRLQRGPVIG